MVPLHDSSASRRLPDVLQSQNVGDIARTGSKRDPRPRAAEAVRAPGPGADGRDRLAPRVDRRPGPDRHARRSILKGCRSIIEGPHHVRFPLCPHRSATTEVSTPRRNRLDSIPGGIRPGMTAQVDCDRRRREVIAVPPTPSSSRVLTNCYVAHEEGRASRSQARSGNNTDLMEIVADSRR